MERFPGPHQPPAEDRSHPGFRLWVEEFGTDLVEILETHRTPPTPTSTPTRRPGEVDEQVGVEIETIKEIRIETGQNRAVVDAAAAVEEREIASRCFEATGIIGQVTLM